MATLIRTLAILLALSLPAAAQGVGLPPYEKDLRRLAEILGSVHYLRELCDADEGQTWRSMMQQLMDAENPTPERRAGLMESFNRGYRGFEQTYHTCNETAARVIDGYLAEGSDIAQRIASRYGEMAPPPQPR